MLKPRLIKQAALLVALSVAVSGGVYWCHESELKRTAQIHISEIEGKLKEPAYSPFPIILDDEKLLLIGADGKIQLYRPKTGDSKKLAEVDSKPVHLESANKIDYRRILVTGTDQHGKVSFSKIYNIASNSFKDTGALNVPRRLYSAIQLDNGKILLAGGRQNAQYVGMLELYEPKTGKYRLLKAKIQPGEFRKAIKLQNNKLIFLGGVDTVEIFDPASETIQTVGKWIANKNFSYQPLDDGRIMLLLAEPPYTIQIFDPKNNNFQEVASKPNIPRAEPATALLPDGKVMLAGGYGCGYNWQSCPYGSKVIEVFDPKDNSFKFIGQANKFYLRGSLIRWKNMLLLIGAGSTTVESYKQGV
jgi:hypothetical protein